MRKLLLLLFFVYTLGSLAAACLVAPLTTESLRCGRTGACSEGLLCYRTPQGNLCLIDGGAHERANFKESPAKEKAGPEKKAEKKAEPKVEKKAERKPEPRAEPILDKASKESSAEKTTNKDAGARDWAAE